MLMLKFLRIFKYIQKNDLSCLVQLRDFQEKKNLEKEFILKIFKDYPKLFFSERSGPLNFINLFLNQM